jgi:hypothetical protein
MLNNSGRDLCAWLFLFSGISLENESADDGDIAILFGLSVELALA